MNDEELFLSQEEVTDYIAEFKKDSDHIYGYEQEEFGICPYITFYIYHQDYEVEEAANRIIDIYEEFESKIIDKLFKLKYRHKTSTWKKAEKWQTTRQELLDEMHEGYKKNSVYFIAATTGDSDNQSAQWAFQSNIRDNGLRYSSLKLSFGEKWYKEHKKQWYQFVQHCLIKLNPIQAYSGYEVGSAAQFPMVSPEFEIVERIFSDYFYGLDIDHPSNMSHSHDDIDGFIYTPSLAAGIRTPTWCFLLSPYWLDKLGLSEEQIRLKLDDPRIEITKLLDPTDPEKFSLWIQLGELSLYPVEEGIPDLLVKANELIKPIRCNDLKLTTLDAWDDDSNPRFDVENSPQWIARFDEDSGWPEGKRVNKVSNLSLEEEKFKVKGGELCPQTGYWQTPAQPDSRQYFKQGEIIPVLTELDWGDVYWYWDGEK
ncbi:type VI immunity family protein [Acinetobacter sp. COS3]|uniref:type VI immunity family protein n=1 Tax=Acinetobacter sp. COS3 TaxID=1397525 RepID=UPI0004CE8946|nr:type VI immunity family protein [Acinetobacter sp. COS3]